VCKKLRENEEVVEDVTENINARRITITMGEE
jgi:hypothetical protein